MADVAQVREDNPQTTYEKEDWPLGWVGLVFIGIFIFLVITPFILMAAYPSAMRDTSRKLLVVPPSPVLQLDPAREMLLFDAHQDKVLNTYYWVDKSKGIVHVPIEDAMKKLAAQGIDGFPKARP
jgi:hypothetical protein